MVINNLESDINTILMQVIKKLKAHGQTVACAESCTGGLVASYLTKLSGSSEVFLGGVVSYSNDVKQKLLKVDSKILSDSGAVSEATALSMARNVRRECCSSIAVATTGIAGPTGGSEEKPVGTVWIAWGDDKIQAEKLRLDGNRDEIRLQTVKVVLEKIDEMFA